MEKSIERAHSRAEFVLSALSLPLVSASPEVLSPQLSLLCSSRQAGKQMHHSKRVRVCVCVSRRLSPADRVHGFSIARAYKKKVKAWRGHTHRIALQPFSGHALSSRRVKCEPVSRAAGGPWTDIYFIGISPLLHAEGRP